MSNRKLLTRDLGTELETRDAVFRPRTFNAAARTVEIVAATTTPVPRQDARGEYDEILDVSGADLSAFRGAPVLNGHRQEGIDNIIGTVVDARLEGDQIIATVQLSQRADLAATVADIEAGIINQVSAGYQVSKWQDGTANGHRTRTAKQWTPREVSMVSVGADPNARTRSHSPAPTINRQIRDLCDRNGVPEIVRDDLIDRAATIEEARMAVRTDMLTRSRTGIRTAYNDSSLDNPEVRIRAAGEALYTRVAPSFRASPQARQFIGLTIPEVARDCLNRSGGNTMGLGADSLITRALHTTSDFALILGDLVERTLRDAYTASPSGIRQLARQTTAADFRARLRLMLDVSGFTLEKVNEGGEFKSGTMVDAGESYKLDSYGRIFGITRQALVNDDLGAFTDLTRRLGQAAAAFEAQFLVDLLTQHEGLGPYMGHTPDATPPLFDASHANVAETGAAPDDTTLSAARLAMRKQTGPGGGLISVTPAFVLVPAEMETATEKTLTAIQATQTSDVNSFSGLSLIVEPRLSDPDRWYLVADPAQIDGLEFAYLAGQPGPQIESRAGFEVDGVQVKVRLDYGAGFVDWRGWYSNEGGGV
jgi:hypothetical protein